MNSDVDILEDIFLDLENAPSVEKLHQLFKSMCEYLGLDSNKPQSALFNLANNADKKKYVASSILRIIETCSGLLWDDQDLRLKLVNY